MGDDRSSWARRLFLARASAGLTAFGALMGARASAVQAQSASPNDTRWQPARHAEDDWLDQVPGKHRLFFDTTTAEGLGQAIFFANNYFTANRSGYGLDDRDLTVIICVRHQSTPFAYIDAIWAKYGAALGVRANFSDPKTKEPPTVNVYQTTGYGTSLRNNGITLDALIKRGVRLAVCQMSTRGSAGAIAQSTGGKADEIYQELVSNLVGNAHMVPAGIVTVNRAQERGYSLTYGA
jgi:intracellular sulfur oxidation DsrE/DsrF family protein